MRVQTWKNVHLHALYDTGLSRSGSLTVGCRQPEQHARALSSEGWGMAPALPAAAALELVGPAIRCRTRREARPRLLPMCAMLRLLCRCAALPSGCRSRVPGRCDDAAAGIGDRLRLKAGHLAVH